jgi:hypothetical protein
MISGHHSHYVSAQLKKPNTVLCCVLRQVRTFLSDLAKASKSKVKIVV